MTDHLRIIQDEVSAGDDVLVQTYGRPRRARVLEVHRAVLKIVYDTGSQLPAYVSRKQATRVEVVDAPPPTSRASRPSSPTLPKIIDAVVDEPLPAASSTMPTAPKSNDNADEIDTWLDMGRDIVGKLEAEIAALGEAEHGMRAAAKELVAEAEAAGERARRLVARLDALRTLVK
jgi:hypothetical protein